MEYLAQSRLKRKERQKTKVFPLFIRSPLVDRMNRLFCEDRF